MSAVCINISSPGADIVLMVPGLAACCGVHPLTYDRAGAADAPCPVPPTLVCGPVDTPDNGRRLSRRTAVHQLRNGGRWPVSPVGATVERRPTPPLPATPYQTLSWRCGRSRTGQVACGCSEARASRLCARHTPDGMLAPSREAYVYPWASMLPRCRPVSSGATTSAPSSGPRPPDLGCATSAWWPHSDGY